MLDFINTLDQNSAAILAKQASSAMSDRAAPNTSDRYGFVDTGKAIEILHGHGFNVVSAMQQKARLKDDQPFAAHMLRFENLAYTNDSGTMPQILLLNSHNTRTSLGLGQGCFRYACSNNIVLASAGVFTRLRHNLATVAGFEDMVREQAKALPVTMQRIESMQRAEIDLDQAAQMAADCCKLRGWDLMAGQDLAINKSYTTEKTISDLLTIRRKDDQPATVWNIFNRVQETFCSDHGFAKVRIHSTSTKHPLGRERVARSVRAIAGNTKLNAGLFEIGERYAEEVA